MRRLLANLAGAYVLRRENWLELEDSFPLSVSEWELQNWEILSVVSGPIRPVEPCLGCKHMKGFLWLTALPASPL